jgi:uncharacterized membrane protein YoaK (UPF0700 family)
MASAPITEKIVPYTLLGMTAVTGLVDAVSFLSLGRVFTANMTGNVVILAFATTRVPGLSIAYSLTALLSFLVGALFGGRIMARAGADSQIRFAAKHSCWRWSFSLWRHFAALDTEATYWDILFNRLLSSPSRRSRWARGMPLSGSSQSPI